MVLNLFIRCSACIIGAFIVESCRNESLPIITTSAVTSITSNTALSGGNIAYEGLDVISEKGVCWSTMPEPTNSDSKTSDGSGTGIFVSNLSGLKELTKYYLRAYATNLAGTYYGNELIFNTPSGSYSSGDQIIADHSIVEDFDKIPESYLAAVKKMMVCFPGESHSAAYRIGMTLLEELYPSYSVNVGTGETYTDQYLRVNDYGSYIGEQYWFTWYAYPVGSRPAAKDLFKNYIKEYSDHGHPIHVLGFGWCNDMTDGYPSANYDQVYGMHWFGESVGGPNGDLCWGVDAQDKSLTGNDVNLTTYLDATEEYNTFCSTNGYVTKVVFTTGPCDYTTIGGEAGYQGHIKHEAIRNFVKADPSRILFDYADILCYDDDGSLTTTTIAGHTFPSITPSNEGNQSVGHISPEGAIRLAKAQWWLLARIAGWDGGIAAIPVTSIAVSGQGGATAITTNGASLQMLATVLPANATNKTVTWSITSGSAYATINPTSGLLTAIDNGTVTVRATAIDGSNVYGSTNITISGQVIPVNSIIVSGAGGVSVITSIGGTLQLSAVVLPANANNKNVTWSVSNGTGQATISSSGLVTAVAYGTVTAKASALDGSGISGTMQITIASQVVPVADITLSGGTSINTDGGTLQLSANITPSNATVKTVTWSISEGQDKATISSNGLVTAIDNGSIIVKATANDGSGVFGTLTLSITNQVIPVTGITISGGTTISIPGGTLQLSATVTPTSATDKSVAWSITGGTGQATISQDGLVTAISSGNVIVRATANGGSNVYGTVTITVTSQTVLVTSIIVTAAGGSATMTGLGTTLQLNAAVSPADASNKSVVWSVINGTGQATISSTGLLTSVSPGTITAKASAFDGSGVSGTLSVSIASNIISVSGISVTGEGGKNFIDKIGGTLQLIAEITPADASDKSLTWSLNNGSGRAIISSAGLVTAEEIGTVTATATANDGSGIFGSFQIEIYTDPNESLLPYVNGKQLNVPLSRRFIGKRISLYNINGRLLTAEISDSDLHEFDISKYHPGLYLIVLMDEFILKVDKVILP